MAFTKGKAANTKGRPGMTDRQRIFIKEYLKSKNAKEAALAAGYAEKTAGVAGVQFLDPNRYPLVAAAVEKGLAELEATALMKATSVRRYVHTVLQFCPGDYFVPLGKGGWGISKEDYSNLPREVRQLIEEMELKSIVEEDGTEVHLLRCKFISKTVAMGLACKYALVERHKLKLKDDRSKKGVDWDRLGEEIPAGPIPDQVEAEILSIGYTGPTAPPPDPNVETVPNADDLDEACQDAELEDERPSTNGQVH